MAAPGGGRKFPEHPVIAKLRPDPAQPAEPTIRIAGYIGRSAVAECVRVYPTLDDLSDYLDIRENDVVHVETAPESVMEQGGQYLWVKQSAEIIHGQTQTSKVQAQFLAGPITQAYMTPEVLTQQPAAFPPTFALCLTRLPRCFTIRPTQCLRTCFQTCYGTCLGFTCHQTCYRTCNVTCLRTCNNITCRTCVRTCDFICITQDVRCNWTQDPAICGGASAQVICPSAFACPSGFVCGGGGFDPGDPGPIV